MSYNQLNILRAERRKGESPFSLETQPRWSPLQMGVCGSATQLPSQEARVRLATLQWEGALLVPCFVQPLRQGEHEG